jgi:hypothetical protein
MVAETSDDITAEEFLALERAPTQATAEDVLSK